MHRILFVVAALGWFAAPAVSVADEPVPVEGAAAPATLTFDQFCCAVKDLCPGKYEFCVIHPYTCCPVKVCLCVPCGCYCVECKCNCFGSRVVLNYPGLFNNVAVRFKKNGSVVVN